MLWIPILQEFVFKWYEKPLSGSIVLANDVKADIKSWFDGTFAPAKEKYLNDHFGFRNRFLRLADQLNYSLFHAVSAKDVVVGKQGFLYEIKYLQAYAGIDFIGEDEVKSRFQKIKFIQDTLEKKGIQLVLLFAPGKASFYPEYIPAPYEVKGQKTNYEYFVAEANKQKVNYLDFNNLFMQLKSTSRYPLYPQTGTHWSVYGMHLAFDTLVKYMEHQSQKKMRHYDYSDVYMSSDLITPDGDIGDGLNLYEEPLHYPMAYPHIKWQDSTNVFQPKVLTVCDSYWMGMYFLGLPSRTFQNHEMWYYNKMIYNNDPQGKTYDPADYDLKTSIEKNDFIFIMATEASLKLMGWGFIEEVYAMYKASPAVYEVLKKQRKYNAEINQIKINMHTDLNWLKQVQKQAIELKISLDSCVQLNAEYMYKENHQNDLPQASNGSDVFAMRKAFYVNEIHKDPKWLKIEQDKSKKWKVSLDSAISIDAAFMANEEIRNDKK